MATATAQRRDVKEFTYVWEGFDRNNRQVRGEIRAASETVVTTNLRRQGIRVTKVKKQSFRGGRRVNERESASQMVLNPEPESVRPQAAPNCSLPTD